MVRLSRVVGAVLALLLGFLAWSPGLSGPYLFDDYVTPLGDPASQSLSAWANHFSFTLRPVTKITYAIESEAGLSEQPGVRRADSLLFHLGAVTLFFFLVRRLEPRLALPAAAVIVGVWLLHPVHADSVLLLSGRTAVLSALLLIGALLALEVGHPIFAAALFLLAVLSRETALAALLPVLVLGMTVPGRSWPNRLRYLMPVVVAALVGLVWCLMISRYRQLADYSLLGRPIVKSAVSQVAAVPVGLCLLLEPSELSVDYGIPLPTKPADKLFLLGLLCYLLAAVGIILTLKRWRTAAVGLALWMAALLPTQSLIPKLDALTNRPLGLALAGLLLALAPLFANRRFYNGFLPLMKGEGRRGLESGENHLRIIGYTALVCGMLVLVLLGNSTAQRSTLFRSELALWGDAASKSTVNARPHLQYAMLLRAEGKNQQAFQELSIARAIDPFSSRIDALWKQYENKEGTQ